MAFSQTPKFPSTHTVSNLFLISERNSPAALVSNLLRRRTIRAYPSTAISAVRSLSLSLRACSICPSSGKVEVLLIGSFTFSSLMSMDCNDAFECTPEMEDFLCERLLDQSQSISERFRALFSLRNLEGDRPREALISATRDPSNLLAHEAAFALGQMQDTEAVPALEEVLKDLSLHPIVRHEAAEALGAIGSEGVVTLLKDTLIEDPILEVQETCELALRRMMQQKIIDSGDGITSKASPFHTVDPAIPASHNCSVDQLREVLLNEEEGIYERYAALFALRNQADDAAIRVIIESLGARSALLRHEVAYVLGQLQHKMAASALADIIKNVDEHPMVRHEAAEALGSIADSESIQLLQEFADDPEPIVSQSCEVALSMLEFERAGKSFEFFFMEPPEVS